MANGSHVYESLKSIDGSKATLVLVRGSQLFLLGCGGVPSDGNKVRVLDQSRSSPGLLLSASAAFHMDSAAGTGL